MQNEIVALTKHNFWTLHKNNVWEIIYLCHRNFLQHVMTQVTEILQHVMTHPGHGNPAALDNSFHATDILHPVISHAAEFLQPLKAQGLRNFAAW